MGVQRHGPAALPPGKRLGIHLLEDGWAPGPENLGRNISSPSAFDPRIAHPVASRYIDYAVPAHLA